MSLVAFLNGFTPINAHDLRFGPVVIRARYSSCVSPFRHLNRAGLGGAGCLLLIMYAYRELLTIDTLTALGCIVVFTLNISRECPTLPLILSTPRESVDTGQSRTMRSISLLAIASNRRTTPPSVERDPILRINANRSLLSIDVRKFWVLSEPLTVQPREAQRARAC